MGKIKITENFIKDVVKEQLPEFFKVCLSGKPAPVIMHQDAFAADYQLDEFLLLGMTIKFAGIFGREVRIIGKNRETLKPQKFKRESGKEIKYPQKKEKIFSD